MNEKRCMIDGCLKPLKARGWCDKHWARWYRRGNPHIVLPNIHHTIKFQTLSECLESGYNKGQIDECWLWTKNIQQGGYGTLHWRGKTFRAHRISYQVYKGEIPLGMYVCHKCDVRNCVNPGHLFIGTSTDNNRDRSIKNRSQTRRGSMNNLAILSEEKVRIIKSELKKGVSQVELGKRFKVSNHAIHKIKIGKNWAHIKDDL